MILLKPSAIIEDLPPGDEILARIERAARTCYKSDEAHDKQVEKALAFELFDITLSAEDRRTEANRRVTQAFVRGLMNRNHESTIEHVGATVRFIVDRGLTHELTRHRLAAYSQESTRYVDYTREDKSQGHCQFIIPPWCKIEPGTYTTQDDGSAVRVLKDGVEANLDPQSHAWTCAMAQAERFYQDLRKTYNWSPQQARSVLPNSTKTEIVMTANMREWRHIFKMRTSSTAHPQMREVMIPLLAEFRSRVPVLFEDVFMPEEKVPTRRMAVEAYKRICSACGTVAFFTDRNGTSLNAAEVKAWWDRMHTCQACGVTGDAVKVELDHDSFVRQQTNFIDPPLTPQKP